MLTSILELSSEGEVEEFRRALAFVLFAVLVEDRIAPLGNFPALLAPLLYIVMVVLISISSLLNLA